MCGIAGFIGEWSAASLTTSLMLDHRGPDGRGVDFAAERGRAARRRLASTPPAVHTDVSGGAQPMRIRTAASAPSSTARSTPLRAAQATGVAGQRFLTQSDTEVSLNGWRVGDRGSSIV